MVQVSDVDAKDELLLLHLPTHVRGGMTESGMQQV